ncbi:hypothetical protein WDU94_000962 [Cyamophila willieti]
MRINETIPHNGEIKLRCQEPLGLYKLLGESSTRCNNGKWAAELPLCIPTTSITNFTVESPPTILVRIPSGTAAVDEDTLIVFPGSILHLECLYLRKEGNPQWTWTSSFRQYLTDTSSTRLTRGSGRDHRGEIRSWKRSDHTASRSGG